VYYAPVIHLAGVWSRATSDVGRYASSSSYSSGVTEAVAVAACAGLKVLVSMLIEVDALVRALNHSFFDAARVQLMLLPSESSRAGASLTAGDSPHSNNLLALFTVLQLRWLLFRDAQHPDLACTNC
jgi:hypothetical protein